MPELPEVETARRQLERWLVGRTLEDVRAVDPCVVRTRPSTTLAAADPQGRQWLSGWVGNKLEATFRHGKRIGLQIGNLGAMHHLGMSGRWERTSPGEPVPRHARLGLVREDEVVIWFVDTRRFGWLVPCAPDALETKLSEGHGPDVWDQPLDGEGLAARFPTRRAIKTALLDQKCVAGMGNIHAVESLWYARIDPRTPAHTLTEAQWSRLAVEMHRQMARTLEMLDVEKVAYVTDKDGPNPFQVYGREADPCPRCGEGVQRGWLAKRSTFWCPICQPRDEARAKG